MTAYDNQKTTNPADEPPVSPCRTCKTRGENCVDDCRKWPEYMQMMEVWND